jgi:hypothetical protein
VGKGEAYYRGVRGSAALGTARLADGEVAAEALAPGELRRVPFRGQLLGAARIRAGFAAIPLVAFDRAGERLEAEAQAAWLQLVRLSWRRNWARVSKKELMARLRLSERRLLRVLDALVSGGFVSPLHRDNRGTLWMVSWPGEPFGEPPGDEVLLGRASQGAAGAAPPDGLALAPVVARAEAATAAARPARARGGHGSGHGSAAAAGAGHGPGHGPAGRTPARRGARELELARALLAARRLEGPAAEAAALREVQELIDEGQGHERIAAAIAAVARRTAGGGTEAP